MRNSDIAIDENDASVAPAAATSVDQASGASASLAAYISLPVIEDHESFRATLASVHSDGRRKWIYARKPKGAYTRARTLVATVLLIFLATAPFATLHGRQFLLFNFFDREFVLFGMSLWPGDFYLVAILFLLVLVSIVVFTATLGRVWCGWLCPQTIFLETIFRRLEWLIEGTAGEQLALSRGGWTFNRIWRFVTKHALFLAISFAIANIFLAYFISGHALTAYIIDGPMRHLEIFISLLVFTSVFYLVFARFREQACLVVCPYGRFMSALVDPNTVTVTYDWKRGETRSKWKKNDTRSEGPAGHCIDCHQCVTVCPTGIDIRNGNQLECIACTACIDACDDVMKRVGLPTGLIRYSSASAIEEGRSRWLTPRIRAYIALWLVLTVAVAALFVFRSDVEVTVLRDAGSTYTTTTHGIANFYDIQIVNKLPDPLPFKLQVVDPAGATVTPLGMKDVVGAGSIVKGRFLITIPNLIDHQNGSEGKYEGASQRSITLNVVSGDNILEEIRTTFLAPED